MKRVISWLLVLALTATVSIGATLAYLTDTDEDVNVMTLGKVKIEQLEYERINDETTDKDATVQEFHNNKPLLPAVTDKSFDYTTGDSFVDWEQIGKDGYTSEIWDPANINNELDKMVFIRNKGDYDAYVRSVFAFEAGKDWDFAQFQKKVHLNINTDTDVVVWDWVETPVTIGENTYFIATATYVEPLKAGAISEISLAQIALDPSATNEDMEALGETYNVLVKSQGIQADGFTDAETALNEGFNAITTANIPWVSDQPIQGIDVRSALRFYQGDANQPIHTQVVNVIFGKNKDYPEIVNNYEGTLVTEEQEVKVYSYYVPNGSQYDVYFLANSTIYCPKDSSYLFQGMSSLVKVDTANIDVSRVNTMFWMFADCVALTTMDVGDWDTGNVTNMRSMFRGDYSLEWLDVGDWDTSNVTTFQAMFSDTKSNRAWMKFNNLDFSKWDTSSATNLSYMFYGCGQMTEMDLSTWDVSNVNNMNHMFCDCYNITEFNFTGWNTSNVTCFSAMFNNCDSVKVLDVSDFDTENTDDIEQMFEYCYNLEEIIGLDKWKTSKFYSLYEAFSCCYKLKSLDLSSWDTSAVHTTYAAFSGCGSLKTIYVGDGWDMSNVTKSTASMFGGCGSLVGGEGTTYVGSDLKYAHVDGGVDDPGYLTHINDKPVTNP